MLKDGLYEIEFGANMGFGTAKIEMKGGRFSGSTVAGALLQGSAVYVSGRNLVSYEMWVDLPPNHTTLTGLTTGPEGRRIAVSGEKSLGQAGQRFSFGLAGRAVDVYLRYVGPNADAPTTCEDAVSSCPTQLQNASYSRM